MDEELESLVLVPLKELESKVSDVFHPSLLICKLKFRLQPDIQTHLDFLSSKMLYIKGKTS